MLLKMAKVVENILMSMKRLKELIILEMHGGMVLMQKEEVYGEVKFLKHLLI